MSNKNQDNYSKIRVIESREDIISQHFKLLKNLTNNNKTEIEDKNPIEKRESVSLLPSSSLLSESGANFKPIYILTLQENTIHKKRTLKGRTIVPPIITDKIITIIEDEMNDVVRVNIAYDSNRQLVSCLKQGTIGVKCCFFLLIF